MTPSVHPTKSAAPDWTAAYDSLKKSHSPPQQGYHRRAVPGLSIQTDCATLSLEPAYPLQRNDSNRSMGSVSTPGSVYSAPPQYLYPPQTQPRTQAVYH